MPSSLSASVRVGKLLVGQGKQSSRGDVDDLAIVQLDVQRGGPQLRGKKRRSQ